MTEDQRRTGYTVWLTGLSGAGKTTVSRLIGAELARHGAHVEVLDGDVVCQPAADARCP